MEEDRWRGSQGVNLRGQAVGGGDTGASFGASAGLIALQAIIQSQQHKAAQMINAARLHRC
jgi:hypothetical protein